MCTQHHDIQNTFKNLVLYIFNVYVNELSELLNKTGIGGNMGGTIINHMLYADDICIVFLSSSGLQQLLNICNDYCELQDLTFNAKNLCVCILVLTQTNIVDSQ